MNKANRENRLSQAMGRLIHRTVRDNNFSQRNNTAVVRKYSIMPNLSTKWVIARQRQFRVRKTVPSRTT